MPSVRPKSFQRYVALGDSSTLGVDDPAGVDGYRGWSQRLAERIAEAQGGLHYANLSAYGLTTAQVRQLQLEAALALRPDLASVFCGTNDVTAWTFDANAVGADIEHMQRALVDSGATVLTFTLPDLTPVMPLARLIAPRIDALNQAIVRASKATGTLLVDFAAHPVATDSRLWSEDRIHANAAGHARMAEALANALQLPGSTADWMQVLPPLPPPSRRQRWSGELRWMRRHLLPFVVKGLLCRACEAPCGPKQPHLAALIPQPKTRSSNTHYTAIQDF
jgi:lysophospholipase L1-like esterase